MNLFIITARNCLLTRTVGSLMGTQFLRPPVRYESSSTKWRIQSRTIANMKLFSYNRCPLPAEHRSSHFRLMKLLSGYGDQVLECNLEIFPIKRSVSATDHGQSAESLPTPTYRALSYHWGKDEATSFLRIIDQGQVYFVSIKPNLQAALLQLRSPREDLYLWVDAICIDQEHKDEKNAQIQRMSYIYGGAEEVVVWLGVEKDDSRQAMSFINRCLELGLDDFEQLIKDTQASPDWAALARLMRRPWFTRRWIIQEIAFARSAQVYCGSDSVPWSDFADIISLFAHSQDQIRKLFKESALAGHHPDYLGDLSELGAIRLVYAADNLFRKSEDGNIIARLLSLDALMSELSTFEVSTPHDIVYAVLWLASDARPALGKRREGEMELVSPVTGFGSPILGPRPNSRRPSDIFSRPYDTFRRGRSTSRATPFPPAPMVTSLDDEVQRSDGDEGGGTTMPPPPELRLPENRPSNHADEEFEPNRLSRSNSDNVIPPDGLPGGPTAAPPQRATSVERTSRMNNGTVSPRQRLQIETRVPNSAAPSESGVSERDSRETRLVEKVLGAIKQKRFYVDYEKDFDEVCIDLLSFTISRSKSLDMICRPWAPDDANLPSWVPQLNKSAFGLDANGAFRRVYADPLVGKPGVGNSPYRASKDYAARFVLTGPDNKRLVTEGFQLDTVEEMYFPAIGGNIPAQWLSAVKWTDTSRNPPDVFWRGLIGNRDSHGQRPPAHWKRVCKHVFRNKPDRGALNTAEIIAYGSSRTSREYVKRMQRMVWSRRLIFLASSKPGNPTLALAPPETERGDIVCILHGCSVPVLLRKHKTQDWNTQSVSFNLNPVTAATNGYQSNLAHPTAAANATLSPNQATRPERRRSGSSVAATYGPQPSHTPTPSQSPELYEFIGECYVHGMMDGEAFQVKVSKGIPTRKFVLV